MLAYADVCWAYVVYASTSVRVVPRVVARQAVCALTFFFLFFYFVFPAAAMGICLAATGEDGKASFICNAPNAGMLAYADVCWRMLTYADVC